MYNPEDEEELRKIQERKLKRMMAEEAARKSVQQQLRELEKAEKAELAKKLIFLRYVDEDVRSRIANIKLANPELGKRVEDYILALLSSGRVARIDFEVFKRIVEAVRKG